MRGWTTEPMLPRILLILAGLLGVAGLLALALAYMLLGNFA